MLITTTVSSPIGTLRLYAELDRLVGLYLPDRPAPDGVERRSRVLREASVQLTEYFAGRRRAFSLELALHGTGFQRCVWDALAQIPYGETRSYAELARAIGRPAAPRAVGAANGRNPISIIVPCHRLIGTDGSLTGYGGGLAAKRWLLEHERAGTPRARPEDGC
ncbi:MAG TPA: methylated-DNA--[protein]-cysteine S-methyltransferase [Kofleriaceae bacterium]|nr:methylated-DNA--[protein]-cysteine S-methyltransferase [Kofleriaceae bacterium]